MDLYSITSIKNLKSKTKLNLYLNDNNLYVQNALKMRKRQVSYFHNKIKIKKEFKEKHPVPKTLYSTSEINFKKQKKRILENFNIKNSVKDLMSVVNNFTDTLNFDDDLDIKTDKEDEVSISSVGIRKNETERNKTNIKQKISKDFFITNKYDKNNELSENKIKRNKTNFKGILYPKRLKKYELPKYEGNNKEEKKYFDYRKKISFPEQEYNKIGNFSEKFNRDLGKISNNYDKSVSRTRFTENP